MAGGVTDIYTNQPLAISNGVFTFHGTSAVAAATTSIPGTPAGITFKASNVVPTGNVTAPRRYGALACIYLGEPS
jgi:hypothetical protein